MLAGCIRGSPERIQRAGDQNPAISMKRGLRRIAVARISALVRSPQSVKRVAVVIRPAYGCRSAFTEGDVCIDDMRTEGNRIGASQLLFEAVPAQVRSAYAGKQSTGLISDPASMRRIMRKYK